LLQAEVVYLGMLRHPHLVKLIGYGCQDEQRMLVYEYMARGSLEHHLFKSKLPSTSIVTYSSMVCVTPDLLELIDPRTHRMHADLLSTLPWCTRLKIAVGAAKGLAFLHEADTPVIYRDFKASNVLLDSVSTSCTAYLCLVSVYCRPACFDRPVQNILLRLLVTTSSSSYLLASFNPKEFDLGSLPTPRTTTCHHILFFKFQIVRQSLSYTQGYIHLIDPEGRIPQCLYIFI